MERPFIGVGVIVRDGGRILMGLRNYAHGTGCWSFPGGHLEFGEDVIECARREVAEETGLILGRCSLGPYTNDVFEKEGKHYVTLFVIGEYAGGTPERMEPEKCSAWEWFPWTEMPSPLFLPIVNLRASGFSL